MKYELSEQVINNILTFLNRSEVKGFNEIQAMQEIINSLHNPSIKDENVNENK